VRLQNVDATLWAVQIALAGVFLYSSTTKGTWPRARLLAAGQTGVARVPMPVLRLIAGAEFVGAVGLILPGLTGIWLAATPLAALGLSMVMTGAAAIHLTQNEPNVAAVNLGLFLMAVFVYFGRMACFG
jgi:uncharacterized membrane protein YphA (DoxX/SURF4 family)